MRIDFYICTSKYLKSVKKFWNILVLAIFINFMALPSIATLLDIEMTQTNMVVSEEENHSSGSFVVFEKTIPRMLNVHDFIKFFESSNREKVFLITDDSIHLTPYLSIFSPPPEA